jgi:putative colanic acid biosynthesis acetyltransferase WcaF
MRKPDPVYQDLSRFNMPPDFRGRPQWMVQLWWLVESLLFRNSPQILYGFRRFLLRLFGAQIGKRVLLRPTAKVTYPWKLKIGDYAWIGDDVVLYTLGEIEIGAHAVVSQRSYICAADHDHLKPDFPIRSRPISIGAQAWVATDVFIGPGVSIGTGAVIGARSSVFRDVPPGVICHGTPCKVVSERHVGPPESL